MPKKHCPKHASYYYRCPDCRRLNAEPGSGTPPETGRRLYPDAFDATGKVRIPVEGQEPPITPSQPRQAKIAEVPPSGRYYGGYKKTQKSHRKWAIIAIIFVAIAIFAIFIWGYPMWEGGISLNQQLYMNKAGSFDYWHFYTLNGWSSQFFFNKIGLVSGFIGMALMILPIPDRSILSLIGDWRGRPNPSRAKCYLFWMPVGFGIFYVVGQLMDVVGMFGWGAYLVEQGAISGDPTTIGNALQVLFDPGSITTSFMSTIFEYQYFWLPIINLVFACIILRVVLTMVEYGYLKQNYILTAAYVIVLIGMIFGITFFNLPLTSVDGLNQIQNWSVVLGFFGFLCLGLILIIYGKTRRNVLSFDKSLGKKTLLLGAITLVIIAIPLITSIPTAIGIDQDENTWTTQRWNKQILNEITWTRITSGTDPIQRQPMSNLISGELNKTKDEQLLGAMRLFDRTYAFKKMLPLTKTEETLADADIVYLDGVEYWVSPKTIDWVQIASSGTPSAVQLHTNLYDHVEGFYAMDTHSNIIIDPSDYMSRFNVSANYPFFFGENQAPETLPSGYSTDFLSSSSDIIWAYDQDIILSTEWGSTSIANYSYTWNNAGGTPDGSLTGLPRFWYTANMGLFSYAISQSESTYLIHRNIMDRVGSILYPGLSVDNDTYLVFDRPDGRLYYAVSIYVNIPLRSYSQSNILRFLGACLVDVKTGTLTFIKNPMYATAPTSDPTWNFWKIYYDLYAWQTAPDWFMSQFRYPENLAETQLNVDYTYHVDNPSNWRRNDAWYQRPANGDLYYIETDLGNGMEFVAVDLVERYGGDTKLMAGFYAIRQGANFGQFIFYDASYLPTAPIGPETATTVLTNTATSELTLIGADNRRDGNVILYPLAGSVYYLIPIYRTSTTTGSSTIDNLKLTGLVNATDRKLGYGYGTSDLLVTAFNELNISYAAAPTSNVSLTYNLASTAYWNGTSTLDADYAPWQFSIQYQDLGSIYDQVNVTLNITMHSNKSIMMVNGQLAQNATFAHGSETYTNYTVGNWTNLYPGEGRTILAKITADITGYSLASINYDIIMYVTNQYGTVTIEDTEIHSLTILNLG